MARTGTTARSGTNSSRQAMPPRKERGGSEGKRTPPKGACVVFFHVRDLRPVKELTDGLHLEWERSKRGDKRGGRAASHRGSHARDTGHPPVFLTDKRHLIALAQSRRPANSIRRLLERALGDAIEHVETRFVKAPKMMVVGRASRHRR